jgi:hypothetical protein
MPPAVGGIFAQDDFSYNEVEGIAVDFQVNGETYFVSLAEDEARWLVFVEGATGTRDIPVYVDGAESEDVKVVVEDKERRKILN